MSGLEVPGMPWAAALAEQQNQQHRQPQLEVPKGVQVAGLSHWLAPESPLYAPWLCNP